MRPAAAPSCADRRSRIGFACPGAPPPDPQPPLRITTILVSGRAGVGLWVRRPTIGAAVDAAVGLAVSAAAELAGRPVDVWDVRVVPLTAVTRNPAEGSVATLQASTDGDPLDT